MNKLNIGIIGLGNQGKLHLKNCSFINELNVVGVADTSKRALKLAEMNGVKNVHLDYKDLLKNKEIDSVIISLPNFLHLEATTYAAEAGKNILLEKPLARNVSEGKEIISRVQKNGVKLMLGYPMRFNKKLIKLHDDINEGYFGEVQVAEAINVSTGPFSSRGEGGRPLPVPSWWFDRKSVGGGALLDLGSHLINLLNWYFGEVTDIKTSMSYIYNMDMEDLATCILKYKNGPTATISVGWVFKDFYGSIQVNGTAKSEYINLRSKNIVKRVTRDIRTKLGQHDHDSTYSELKYFVDCIINDKLLKPSGEEGLQDLQVIESAYRIESRQTQTEKTQIE